MPLPGYIDPVNTDREDINASAALRSSAEDEVRRVLLTGGALGSLSDQIGRGIERGLEWAAESRGASFTATLTPAEANAKYGIEGELSWDNDVSESEAAFKHRNKRDELYRRDVLGRNDSVGGLEAFTYGLIGGVVDPASLAISFVPVAGEARWAGIVGKAGLGRQLMRGAWAGAQGGIMAEGLAYGLAQNEGRDYGLEDAGMGVLAGTVFGAAFEGAGYGLRAAVRAAQARSPEGRMAGLIRATAQDKGVGQYADVAVGIARFESGLDPRAQNPKSSAGGIFQFLDSTWDEMGGGDKYDPALNIERGVTMLARNAEGLRNTLGREPTNGELYLAHQQGLGGARALLSNPEKRAVDVLAGLKEGGKPIGLAKASERIRLNGGHIDMTAGEFARLWAAKIETVMGADGATGGGDYVSDEMKRAEAVPVARAPEMVRMMDEIDRAGATVKAIDDLADGESVDLGELIERAVREPRAKAYLNEADVNLKIPAKVYDTDVAVTVRGTEFPVRYALIEADDLRASHDADLVRNPDYPDELQPRERDRAGSQERLLRLEREFNPKRLMHAVEAESGAPIVAPDGTVESGNGRVIVIKRNAETGSEIYQRYRQELIDQGYDPSGMRAPVLVRVRQQAMTGSERVRISREMNADTAERYSASEQAFVDAAALGPDDIGLYQGGAITQAKNDPFARSFVAKAGAGQENALIDPATRKFSQEGLERMKAAMVAKAFDDRQLVYAIFESSDPKIKSIGDALTEVAPTWAKMRGLSAKGELAPGADTTGALAEAIAFVRHVRDNRLKLDEQIAERIDQVGLFGADALSPEAHEYLRLMYRDDAFSVQRRAEDIAADLGGIAEAAMRSSADPDLFGEVVNFDVRAQIDVIRAREARFGVKGTDNVIDNGTGHRDAGDGPWVSDDSGAPVEDGEFGLISIERPRSGRAAEADGGTVEPDTQALAARLEAAGVSGAKITGHGPLGPELEGLQGRWADAVTALRSLKSGDARGVLSHPEVGPIDVVWGNDVAGLQKIVTRHPEVLADLPELMRGMAVESRSVNRIRLQSPDAKAVIRLDYSGQKKTWLLTAFGKDRNRRGTTGSAPDDVQTAISSERPIDDILASRSENVDKPWSVPVDPEINSLMREIEGLRAQAGVPFSWVAADSVYGVGDIEMALKRAAKGYVPGVNANHPFRSWGKPLAVAGTAKDIAEALPEDSWRRLSAGDGTRGARLHDWVYLELADLDADDFEATFPGIWTRGLLIRRNIADGDLAFFSTWCPIGTSIETLVRVEGHRWAIEDSFETAKNEPGLDHNETRSWHGWHRHVSLVMLAFAMMTAIRHRANAAPPQKQCGHQGSGPAIDPLVSPGNTSDRNTPGATENTACTCHCMVALATSTSSRRTTSTHQIKIATVLLGKRSLRSRHVSTATPSISDTSRHPALRN